MTTTPQAVTERYVSNLITNGRNKEFDVIEISRDVHIQDDVCVGVFFWATLSGNGELPKQRASGATISQAVRRALEKHGVTFR